MGERSFGEEIGRLRKKKEWTIREFAQMVLKEDGQSMSPSYLCDIEHGRREPSDEVIRRMAELLGASFDDLMDLAKRTPPDIKEIVRQNRGIRRMLRKAKQSGFKDWKQVERIIENQTVGSAKPHKKE